VTPPAESQRSDDVRELMAMGVHAAFRMALYTGGLNLKEFSALS
jgi:hypothetical protein